VELAAQQRHVVDESKEQQIEIQIEIARPRRLRLVRLGRRSRGSCPFQNRKTEKKKKKKI
jgi:hypothetical protein